MSTRVLSSLLLGLLLIVAQVDYAHAQAPAADNATIEANGSGGENPPPDEPPSRAPTGVDRVLSDIEFQLSMAVLLFGLVTLIAQYLLMWKSGFEYQSALRMSTVTLVVVGTLFVITAGLGADQIAPAMGLFGTIVGYLLGRGQDEKT